MISSKQADSIYSKMHEAMLNELDHKELEALSVVMTSSVVIKAFGRSLAYCQGTVNEMADLDMKDPGSIIEFTRGQGQILGIKTMIQGLLSLVTKEEKDSEDDNN